MVLKFKLRKEIEDKFREMAMKKFGYMKGSLKKATEEALGNWIKQKSINVPKVEDPFKMVEGILIRYKGKKTSVQLQHEVKELW